ncbi:hypothetical protein LMBIIBHN_00309 [Aeromonas salmonicida]
MEKLIYTAMSGAQHTLMAQQIRANNLANVNTAGFRADFERVSAYALTGDGYPAGSWRVKRWPARILRRVP